MKKIINCFISAAVLVSLAVSAYAASSAILITNGEKDAEPITYTYDFNKTEDNAEPIKSLMTKLSDLTVDNRVTQEITFTNEGNVPVSLYLRLSNPQKDILTADELSALNYYNIDVADRDGNAVYSDTDGEYKDGYRDIPLGVCDKENTYNITVSVDKNLDNISVKNAASKLDWSITAAEYAVSEPTVAPIAAISPTATVSTNIIENKNGVMTLAAGEYLCGEDIKEGIYTISGNGIVRVYTPDGLIKTNVALKSGEGNSNGVVEYVIQLSEGEKLLNEAQIILKPHTASATASPKATSVPTASKVASAQRTSDSKTNPKTGDAAPIALVSMVGVMSIAMVVYMEYKKRQEN